MTTKPLNRRNVITLVVVVLALCIILPNLSSFNDSLATLHDAAFIYVGLAGLFWLSTFFAAALVYKFIALRSLPYGPTLLVQLASGFTNRLAPMGAGIVTLNIGYLVKRGHSALQAGAVVALNNILGFVGIVILLLGAIVLTEEPLIVSLQTPAYLSPSWMVFIALCLVFGLIMLAVFGIKMLQKIKKAVQIIATNVLHKPFHLLLALLAAMAITVGYAAALYSTELAFNVHLSIAQALFVLTLGVTAAAITPTPGGIGGAEAGLIVALIAVGVSSHQALAVALTYRLLIYWLPILPGFICLQVALRKRYI